MRSGQRNSAERLDMSQHYTTWGYNLIQGALANLTHDTSLCWSHWHYFEIGRLQLYQPRMRFQRAWFQASFSARVILEKSGASSASEPRLTTSFDVAAGGADPA